MAFKMKGFAAHDMFNPTTGKKVVAKTHAEHIALGARGYTHSPDDNSPLAKKPKGAPDWHDSDAPDAKSKFKSLSPNALANWLIKTRKGNLSKIISSLNQQIVFNRKKKPSYAAKMKTVQNIVRKKLGKDKKKK